MAKRFNNLKAALKLLRPLTGTGDAPDLADTSALGFFQAVQAGKKTVEYGDRDANSRPKSLVTYSLIPFATPDTDAPRVLTTMSKRSEEKLVTVDVTVALLGVDKTDEKVNIASRLFRFESAKAVITVKQSTNSDGSSTASQPISKLTGRKYKKVNKDSYTFPMGYVVSGTGSNIIGKGFKEAKNGIVDALKTKGNKVSFKPERYE
jgi:hypothetical protein